MANDINSVVLVGRLTRDAEKKEVGSKSLLTFSIATNRSIKDKEDKVSYFDIQVWGKYADILEDFVKKGKQVVVAGSLEQQRWEKNGEHKSKIVVNAVAVEVVGSREDKHRQDGPERFDDDSQF